MSVAEDVKAFVGMDCTAKCEMLDAFRYQQFKPHPTIKFRNARRIPLPNKYIYHTSHRSLNSMSSTPSLVSAEAQHSFDAAGYEAFKASLSEPSWLTRRRDAAWQQFEQTAWPDRKQEDWMRSDLRGFKLDRFQFPKQAGSISGSLADHHVPQYLSEGVDLAGQLETLDGAVVSEKLSDRWTQKGVSVR